jgi:UDP-2,3-diacylglucosamine hydrolase
MAHTLSLPRDGRVLLVSDVHLSSEQPDLTACFFQWLKAAQSLRPDWLILLGDLVDAWVGDDQMHVAGPESQLWAGLADALHQHATQGTQIGLVVGNRDFLMGELATQSLGAQPLGDWVRVEHPGIGCALLCHGDQLCLDDTDYQAFRSLVRARDWQQAFLSRSLEDRMEQARQLRSQSDHEIQLKQPEIMDIQPQAAMAALDEHACNLLIHGHTHRPGCDTLPDGRTRWVLPDWGAPPSGRGGGLLIERRGVVVQPLF